MKFIRLRIANYRGVRDAEVKFGPTGITLVQGPNEAGKTSLGESIGLLFDYLDSSKHRNIESIKPVHRDEGPEIELQAESGPYAFTYFKRYLKRPETRLVITKPKPENYTGREAHERAESILLETLDVDLWKALIIQQGDAIHQPNLDRQTSLSAALDKAAGGKPADPQEESLFDKVKAEYLYYYTERGAERKELADARKVRTESESMVFRIEENIRNLEIDVERAATLQRELINLRKQEDDLVKQIAEYSASLEEIGVLEKALSEARLKLDSAQKSMQVARKDNEARQALLASVQNAAKAHDRVRESSLMILSDLDQAELKYENAKKEYDEIEKERKIAELIAALRRDDFDYYNSKLHFEQLRERKERIDEARKNAAEAEIVLSRNRVDSRILKSIQEAERGFLTANAQLQTGAPSLTIRSRTNCNITIDDADVRFRKGEAKTIHVADKTRVGIPGTMDLEITAGSSIEGLTKALDEANRVLGKACAKAGVTTPDEARQAFDNRREAMRQIESKDQIEKDNLRDLNYEELDRKLRGLEQYVPEYLSKRVHEHTIAADLESAKGERAEAVKRLQDVIGRWESSREKMDSARSVRDVLNTRNQELRVQIDLLANDLQTVCDSLDRARNSNSDKDLEIILANAIVAVASEEAKVENVETSLKSKNPDKVRTLAETSKGSLKTIQTRRSSTQTELTETQTRLKVHGEEGLHEQLQWAQTALERQEAHNSSMQRRALSAKCLYEVMQDERDNARKAYIAPLKDKIESLGRLVFDESFQVEISDDLRIVSRTIDKVTVPFDYLSGGTREQLSLVFRSACAIIVSNHGGVPLILDDTLGYTDPDRLRLMGAVLAKAAKDCQILVFTCVPDRYCNVGEATVTNIAG